MDYNRQMIVCEAIAYRIRYMSMESKAVSARAAWHRPNIVGTERNLQGIRDTLQIFKDCNINLIFVESFYGGMSLFRSEKVDYHKDIAGYSYGEYPDYLTAFCAEAEKLGIEVHAWVENFFVGLSADCRILNEHPSWLLYNEDGSYLQRNEGGAYVFLDPANPEVQAFLIDYYCEMLQKVPALKGSQSRLHPAIRSPTARRTRAIPLTP